MFCKTTIRGLLAVALVASAVAVAQATDVFNMPTGQTSLEFVPVGDAGNVADPATSFHNVARWGAVSYNYQIGKYDVTLGQYAAFLNAVAKTDTYGLYNSYMSTDFATQGIGQSGSPGSFSYSVTGSAPGASNMPVFAVSWGDAARFCNWLQNGQPTMVEGDGTTETGAYTLSGGTSNAALIAVTRNAGATYFIPSDDEWYKAAYYKTGGTNAGYWVYPTKSDIDPINSLALALTSTNAANGYLSDYTDPTNYLTPVGTFAASPGPYGTFDQGGDVYQWTEENLFGEDRGLRGGTWNQGPGGMTSYNRNLTPPTSEFATVGFRVASVPEPGCLTLLLVCAVMIGIWLRVKRITLFPCSARGS
ncbi:MAG: SUMF1/EgtB/PvdO family nonheme iron enzyme [Planctomycetota bacterium]